MNISKYMEDRTGSLRDGVQVWGCGDGMQALVPRLGCTWSYSSCSKPSMTSGVTLPHHTHSPLLQVWGPEVAAFRSVHVYRWFEEGYLCLNGVMSNMGSYGVVI